MKSTILFRIMLYICIIYSTECRTIRRQTNDEIITTSTGTVESCDVGEFESAIGGDFRVREDSNVTLVISVNTNHASLVGQSTQLRIYKDNTNIPIVFPNSIPNYPVDAMLSVPGQPEVNNFFIVYEFGLIIVALKLTSGQANNNGEYRVEVGTLNTPLLASATSNVEFIIGCPGQDEGLIKRDESEIVWEEVGSYTHRFGGSITASTGSNVSLRILYDENHPKLQGEVAQVTLYKDGEQLMSVFSISIVEGEFPLEGEARIRYPNIFIRYDHGFVYNSLVIRSGDPSYNGDYTLTISSRTRFGIANATTRVEFAPDGTTPPLLKRSGNELCVQKTEVSQGVIGDSFVVLSIPWNTVSILAEDTNNNLNLNWVWYFTPVGGDRQQVTSSQDTIIMQSRNSSALILKNGGEHQFGVYTAEARNSAGLDSFSSEINRLMPPTVRLAEGTTTRGSVKIGENVDLAQLENEMVVIEARDQTGFPRAETSWFFSKCRDGERMQIQNSEDFEIISDGTTKLIIRNTTKLGVGYIYAMTSNLAGVDEAYSILGKAPEFRGDTSRHSVAGFTTGQIGDSFKLSTNCLFSIEASPEAFPPVSFSWSMINPLNLYSEETEVYTGEGVAVGTIRNKSVLTQFKALKHFFVRYTVRVSNELGSTEESSYVICI